MPFFNLFEYESVRSGILLGAADKAPVYSGFLWLNPYISRLLERDGSSWLTEEIAAKNTTITVSNAVQAVLFCRISRLL